MSLKDLLHWSQKEFKDIPWRKNRTLYKTLVSEIMLQQTTVSTVKNHFERFLMRFPDLKSLALASEEDLVVAWKGLGYYRRARNLKKIAVALFKDHKGLFPKDAESLQEISGIGPYTSNALVAIGMDLRGLAVDANIERVIARLYGINEMKGPKLQKKIQELFLAKKIFADKIVSYRALNEALMDLGRTYCQARKASCELCPMKKDCVARKERKPLSYPFEKTTNAAKPIEHELHLLRVYVMKKDQLLVYKKNEKEWLAGQYEVPTFIVESTDKTLKQYPFLNSEVSNKLKSFKTGITKYKIKNSILVSDLSFLKKIKFTEKMEWKTHSDENSNLSIATSKGLKFLLAK